MGGRPIPFGLGAPLALDAPVPISASWTGGAAPVVVKFDGDLETAAAVDTLNWFVRLNDQSQFITGVSVSGDEVTVSRASGLGAPGPNVVSYSPPPFDVRGLNGAAVAAFSNLTVTAPP